MAVRTLSDIKPDELYTVGEVATVLRKSQSAIYRYIKTKRVLKAHIVGGEYRILGKDVLKYWNETMIANQDKAEL